MRTIREHRDEEADYNERRAEVAAAQNVLGERKVITPYYPRDLGAGDPMSEGGTKVTFEELDPPLQVRIESLEGNYAAPVQTIQNLRDVAPAYRDDKQIRLVEDAAALYRFDTADTSTPDDGDLVVAPTDPLPPNGRWFKLPPSPAPATSVVSETSFGQAPAIGTTPRFSHEDHTHGSPTDPVPAHALLPNAHHTEDHVTRHQNGGADELNVAGLSGALADPQTPTSHATSHRHGGTDEVATAIPAANAIPKAAADAELAAAWLKDFVGGTLPATPGVKGAVPAPSAANGADYTGATLLGNGAWGQPHGARAALGQMWRWNTQILDVDPGNGQYSYNNALQASATVLYVNDRSQMGDQSAMLAALVPRDRIYLAQTNQDLQRYQIWRVTGAPIIAVGYVKIPVALVEIGSSSVGAGTLIEWGFSFIGPHPVVDSKFFGIAGSTDFVGDYAVKDVAANGSGRLAFQVPTDFGVLVGVGLVGIVSAGAALAGRDIDFYTSYAAVGELSTQHQQSDIASVYDLSGASGRLYQFDITSLFTNLAAGDYVGVQVDHNAIGGAIDYLGITLSYSVA